MFLTDGAGEVLRAAGRDLDDAVRAGVREALQAAFSVCEDDTLMAGKANAFALAVSSIWA